MPNNIINNLWNKYQFSLETLNERIRAQKTVFLLQTLKFPRLEQYSYSFYLYGPYSSSLARDLYALNPSAITTEEFSQEEVTVLEKFESLLKTSREKINSLDIYELHELLADIIFLKQEGKNKEDIFKIVSSKHEYLNKRNAFEQAWNILAEKSIIS